MSTKSKVLFALFLLFVADFAFLIVGITRIGISNQIAQIFSIALDVIVLIALIIMLGWRRFFKLIYFIIVFYVLIVLVTIAVFSSSIIEVIIYSVIALVAVASLIPLVFKKL